MLYLVSPSTPMLRDRIRAGEFGAIVTPATGYRVDGLPIWAADNACGPGPNGNACNYPGDEKWAAWLAKLAPHAGQCLFAAVPDVVGDAAATMDRFAQLAHVPRALGYPVALVAQNGLELLPVPWDQFEVLFIGGDDAWKLGLECAEIVREATARGKRKHMGRVNGGPRWRYADGINCDTADGKCVNIAPEKNVKRPAEWAAKPTQGVLL